MNYEEFIERKSQSTNDSGFAPIWMPEFLFDFQRALRGGLAMSDTRESTLGDERQ